MAAVDNTTITNQLAATSVPTEIPQILKTYLWSWFETHQDTVVFKKKVLFIPINITVAQCEPVFVMLLGPRPS